MESELRKHLGKLTSSSLYIDVGTYDGEYLDIINNASHCNIICFEPIEKNINVLKQKYNNQSNIRIIDAALSDENTTTYIQMWRNIKQTGSTIMYDKVEPTEYDYETIKVVDVKDFMNEIEHVDIMKINIEGAEYKVLPRMIENNFFNRIDLMIIQFHKDHDPDWKKRDNIQLELNKTHDMVFYRDYGGGDWEFWLKK